VWTFNSDYVLPSHNWIPPMGITLTGSDLSVVIPGAGGSVWVRSAPDLRKGSAVRQHFLGLNNYNENPGAFNSAIQICTPLTADPSGNIYFGYESNGAPLPGYPNGVPSGLARLARGGATGSYVAASSLSNNSASKVAMNCAPALSSDSSSVYVACNSYDGSAGYLCKVSGTASLTSQAYVLLKDPKTGNPGAVLDDGTSSPTVGPDGDVYYGVLESNWPTGHHDRGWLLHYDSALKNTKIPGSFGWDMSAAIVPANLITSYKNGSSYLVLTKYNDYSDPGIGGSGQNKVAVLDPNNSENDPIDGSSVQVMQEVVTVLGPTPNTGQPGVREWCINSAAVDQANQCAVVNSEDGHVYRWSFNNTATPLSPGLKLANPTGEAYTPTVIGPDGAVYAINNATLCCCVASSSSSSANPSTRPGALPMAPPTFPALPSAAAIAMALLIGAGLAIGATMVRRRRLAPIG